MINDSRSDAAGLLAWLKRVLGLVRAKPFDTSLTEGRSQERHRRIALTALAASVAKIVSLAAGFITVPLTLSYLGEERYGLWLTMSSVIAMLNFADLGVGNGLLTLVAEADGRRERQMAQRYVSSAFFLFLSVATMLTLIYAVGRHWINWPKVFNVSAEHRPELLPAMSIWLICFLVNLPLGVVERVRAGMQEGFTNGLFGIVGSVLGLSAILVAIHFKASLPRLVLATAAAPTIATLVNGVTLFGWQHPWLRPHLRRVEWGPMVRLLRLGVLYLILQMAGTIAFAADNLIVSHLFGPEAVPQLAVPMRLFSVVPLILSMVLTPLWPAYSEAVARRDAVWVKRTLKRSMALAVGVSLLLSGGLVLAGEKIIALWVGPTIQPEFALMLALGIWIVLNSAGIAFAMFLNGVNAIGFQTVSATFLAFGAIGAKVWLAKRLELPGIVWGTTMAYVIFTVIPMGIYLPGLLKRLAGQSENHQPGIQVDR